MDAIVWLLNTIGRKWKRKRMITGLAFLALFVIVLTYMEINAAFIFFISCLAMAIERFFFDEIAKNNVIPLKVICGDKLTLVNLFAAKVRCMEVPYLFIAAVISVGWNYVHCTEPVYIFWTLVAAGLFWGSWSQCIFLHFCLMFCSNKSTTKYEMCILFTEGLIMQLMQIFSIPAQVAVLACATALSIVAFAGKQVITSKEREKKNENISLEKEKGA